MEIHHDQDRHQVWTIVDGEKAHVEYELRGDTLDIIHTIVPTPISGRNIAAKLVEYTYAYAATQNLLPAATCTYAAAYLRRHPQ